MLQTKVTDLTEADIHDRILDAYYGKMGETLQRQTHERINWICSQVNGTKVLDVGCSQGIVPLLLAREGCLVTGIDIDPKSIEESQSLIAPEPESVRSNICLIQGDFLKMELQQSKFDTITMTEVLEHLVQPGLFVERAFELLEENALLIITVPFGINDHIDHKQTFYLHSICSLIAPYFEIVTVNILGKWIGISAQRRATARPLTNSWQPSSSLMTTLEDSFFLIERQLQDQLKTTHTALTSANHKYRTVTQQVTSLKDQVRTLQKANDDVKAMTSSEQQRLSQQQDQQQREWLAVEYQKLMMWLEKDRDTHQETLNKLQEKIYLQSEQLVEHRVTIARLDTESKATEQAYNSYREQRTNLETQLAQQVQALQDKTEQITQLHAQRTHLETQLTEKVQAQQEATEKYHVASRQMNEQREQLQRLQQQLDGANQKYKAVTSNQIPELKHKLDTMHQQHRATHKSMLAIKSQLSREEKQRLAAEKQAIKTRGTLSFQLGYALIFGTKSFAGLAKLPGELRRIQKEAAQRRQLRQLNESRLALLPPESSQNQGPQSAYTIESQAQIIKLTGDAPTLTINKPLQQLKIACVMDEFTFGSYQPECRLQQLTPEDWETELSNFAPELLFIESAWRGKEEKWGNKVGHNSQELQQIIGWCRSRAVPTLFWNKEDPVHFETFLNVAKQFDYVFTTDLDCIHRYKAALGHDRVYFLPFACQPANNNPIEKYVRKDAFCFAGAYYVKYPERTKDLENFVGELPNFKPLEIYDRNYGKDDPNYQFPPEYQPYIVGTLPFDQIDKAYKGYRYAINLNSIKQSQTMFARRVYELLASNTVTISNFSRGVRLMFGDLVTTTDSGAEVVQRLEEKTALDPNLERLRLAALRKVLEEHTYADRLRYLVTKIAREEPPEQLPWITVVTVAESAAALRQALQHYQQQSYRHTQLRVLKTGRWKHDATATDSRIQILEASSLRKQTLAAITADANYVALMVSGDYYGANYLKDIALSTRYSDSPLIGKGEFFEYMGKDVIRQQASTGYKAISELPLRASAARSALVADLNIGKFVKSYAKINIQAEDGLAIDPFNYCRGGMQADPSTLKEVQACVDDLPNLNTGIPLIELTAMAERIKPATEVKVAAAAMVPEELQALIIPPKNSAVTLRVDDSEWAVSSTLEDGKHEYLYANRDMRPAELGVTDQLEFHLETSPGLNLQWVVFFLDAQKQRISHIIKPANCNISFDLPLGTEWIRFGLRVYAAGSARIGRLVLGHIDQQPPELVPQADYLLVTNHYPTYDDIYRNGFVHSRLAAYRESGLKVDVFRVRLQEQVAFHEFNNIDVTSGNYDLLQQILQKGNYKHILVHFLDALTWDALSGFIENTRVTVWIHGSDIQPWWRRKFNFTTEDALEKAKQQTEVRLTFWRNLLKSMPKNLQLVFVSKHLAEEVMVDLGYRLPESQYQIIHNPIDTKLFSHQEKPPAQRKKILSIRPYSSRVYANDLTVQAILNLSQKPFFNELEFRLIGDGPLFEATLEPLRNFSNVIVEKRFLNSKEIAAYHKHYGVFLCPSRSDTQGVSRDEAMASGLVPVTNAVAAIPEFIDKSSSFLAEAENFEQLANALETLYKNPDIFLEKSKNSRANVVSNRDLKQIIAKEISIILA